MIFVLNAKLYLLKLPAVGESTDDTIHELNYDISSAIPIVWNIKFSSYINSYLLVLIIKFAVPPLYDGFNILYIFKVFYTLNIGVSLNENNTVCPLIVQLSQYAFPPNPDSY